MKRRILNVFALAALVLGSSAAWSQTTTFNYTGGIEIYTVPAGATSISIEAAGAQGGNSGGEGAIMIGTFAVTAGEQFQVMVGQAGGMGSTNQVGGGGGTFVADMLDNPIIVGGGGGGRAGSTVDVVGIDANTTEDANDGYSVPGGSATRYGVGGTGGNGCTVAGPGGMGHAGNGAGFFTDGAAGLCGGSGMAFVNGGAGGTGCSGGPGGYGGGGNGGNWGGGGGGGYSGGGGSYHGPTNGGGGGSFNSGTDQTNTVGNTGDGYVTFTVLCTPVTTTISSDTICYGDSLTLTAVSGVGGTLTWDNGAPNGSAFVPDTLGMVTYTTSSDTTDCEATAMILIQESPDFSVAATDELSGGDGTALITLTGGVFPFTFDWDIDGTGDFDDDQNQTGLSAGTYTVTVMHGNGCTATQSVTVNSQLGVEELSTALGRIYPNPATDNITISYPGNYTYSIVNAAGQAVVTAEGAEETNLNVNTYEAGTYFVHIVGENYSEIVKITKM